MDTSSLYLKRRVEIFCEVVPERKKLNRISDTDIASRRKGIITNSDTLQFQTKRRNHRFIR